VRYTTLRETKEELSRKRKPEKKMEDALEEVRYEEDFE
jgi:hypothetical protein